MASPKKSLGGDLLRTTITPGSGKDNYPLGRSQEFEMDGYHSNPNTKKAGNTKYSSQRKDFNSAKGNTAAPSKDSPMKTRGITKTEARAQKSTSKPFLPFRTINTKGQ